MVSLYITEECKTEEIKIFYNGLRNREASKDYVILLSDFNASLSK
jgi:hypothetical protein